MQTPKKTHLKVDLICEKYLYKDRQGDRERKLKQRDQTHKKTEREN